MKTRLILLSSAALAALLVTLSWPKENENSAYEPRILNSSGQEAAGAMEYYQMLRTNYDYNEVREEDYLNMAFAVEKKINKESNQKDLGIDLSWQLMGPNNFGGRGRDIAFTSDGVIYTGGISGGLFRSFDNGNTWQILEGFKENVNVSAVEESGSGVLFVGTGNSYEQANASVSSGFQGQGLFSSTDDGVTWNRVDGLSVDPLTTNGVSQINDIAAHVTDPDKIWLGTNRGLILYDSSTGEITDEFDGLPGISGALEDFSMSSDGQVILVAYSSDVFISNNGGTNWTEIGNGNDADELPLGSATRVGVAISPEDSNYMYVLISNSPGRMGGVYASENGGNTWFNIWPANDANNTNIDIDPFGTNTQGWYDLAITVLPNDKFTALVGGVTLWECGINSQPVQIATNFGFGSNYVHSDIHDFEWNNNQLFIASDGGIFKSVDILWSDDPIFIEASFGLTTTQFYGIGISSTGKANGGTQDNSCFLLDPSTTNAVQQFSGDGFDTDISKVDDNALFVSAQYGSVARSFDGGASAFADFFSFPDSIELVIGPLIDAFDLRVGPFYTTLRLHENTDNELSQDSVLFSGFEGDSIFLGDVVTVQSNNLNAPFDYELTEFILTTDTVATGSFTITVDDFNNLVPFLDEEVSVGLDTFPVVLSSQESSLIDSTEVNGDDITIYVSVPVNARFEYDIQDYIVGTDTMELPMLPERFTIAMIDRYTSLFALATDFGIFVTREALNGNALTEWGNVTNYQDYEITDFVTIAGTQQSPVYTPILDNSGQTFAAALNGRFTCIEFSADGGEMYYGDSFGSVFRVSGLNEYWGPDDVVNLQVERIFNQNNPVTGISLDPLSQRIAISIGGYGGSGKVWYAENANAMPPSTTTSNFDNIWFTAINELAGMPCYDVLLPVNNVSNDEIILVATEFGVWGTNDIGNQNSWEQCSDGFGNVPVFDLKQQWRDEMRLIPEPTRPGEIFAGTHGKGLWRTSAAVLVGLEELEESREKEINLNLQMFPNPASDVVSIELELTQGMNLDLEIYNISGQMMERRNLGFISSGLQVIPTYVGDLSSGNYVVRIAGDQFSRTGKLVVQ